MLAQICSVVIFVIMFYFIITEKIENYKASLLSALATLLIVFLVCERDAVGLLSALNFKSMLTVGFWLHGNTESSSGISWDTILFVLGMMIMVEGMSRSGFFRWLCFVSARLVRYKTELLLIMFMLLSFVLSMFVGSITVIMFLAAISVELASILKISPVPFILAEIFCANLGGAASMCGDPPNIIIGTAFSYTFYDFITNTGFIAFVSLIFIILFFSIVFRKELKEVNIDINVFPKAEDAIVSKRKFVESIIIFLLTIVLLITHAETGLTVATVGVIIGVLTLICNIKEAKDIYLSIDHKTIFFFIGLFVVVAGMESTGVLNTVSNAIVNICGDNKFMIVVIILVGSTIASAIIDNVPFVATMLPIVKSLSAIGGVDLQTLAWALSIGADIGGNATPIGASANVVGTSISARAGHRISWGKYCPVMIPGVVIVLIVSIVIMKIRY